jgi:hypothetical protein
MSLPTPATSIEQSSFQISAHQRFSVDSFSAKNAVKITVYNANDTFPIVWTLFVNLPGICLMRLDRGC